MRAKEFLLEYNRQITANQLGIKLLQALRKDPNGDVSPALNNLRYKIWPYKGHEFQEFFNTLPPQEQKQMVDLVLQDIENKDPTTNKQYTPWLARMYAKGADAPTANSGSNLKIEDMNRNDLLRMFDIAKKRRMIKPEHADINRFKYYHDFEDAMEHHYNNFEDLDADQRPEGTASKVYNDENVTIIVPEDEAAACKYGRNTRWCTASTRGYNLFDAYNRQGKLYILIPKKPKYEGEKYQLHFSSNSSMDENDDPVPFNDVFNRFPGIKEFFLQKEPGHKDKISYAPDEEIQQAIESVAELVQQQVWDTINEWEIEDGYYRQYLRDEGYVDEEGDIDYDRAADEGLSYTEYNYDADRWAKEIWNTVTPSPEELRDIMADYPYEYQNFDTMNHIPDIIGTILKEKYQYDRDSSDRGIGDWLRQRVSMKKVGDHWEAYIVQRQPRPAK